MELNRDKLNIGKSIAIYKSVYNAEAVLLNSYRASELEREFKQLYETLSPLEREIVNNKFLRNVEKLGYENLTSAAEAMINVYNQEETKIR